MYGSIRQYPAQNTRGIKGQFPPSFQCLCAPPSTADKAHWHLCVGRYFPDSCGFPCSGVAFSHTLGTLIQTASHVSWSPLRKSCACCFSWETLMRVPEEGAGECARAYRARWTPFCSVTLLLRIHLGSFSLGAFLCKLGDSSRQEGVKPHTREIEPNCLTPPSHAAHHLLL